MDKIWDRKILRSRRSLAVVAGMKKLNDHAERTKVERQKKASWKSSKFQLSSSIIVFKDDRNVHIQGKFGFISHGTIFNQIFTFKIKNCVKRG